MILDTNALSAFFDGEEELLSLLAEANAVHLPVIVIGEYRFGLRASRLRGQRENQLMEFTRACSVLPVLESTTLAYASIKENLKKTGKPIPENDVWIAALAMEYSLPVLSDDHHFDAVPQIKRLTWRTP